MDTQKYFMVENLLDFPNEIEIPEIDEKIQLYLKRFVSFSETLQNVHQFFEVFLFNLEQMDHFCIMYYNDEVIRKSDGKKVDFIEINALFINVISAGKTLIDKIDNFFKTEVDEIRAKEFKNNYLSKKYDDIFSYRFLLFLRNFAQHGNLPISRQPDGKYCFDLIQILATIHMKVSDQIKKSMQNVAQEITEKYMHEPCVALTYTIDTYSLTVVELYYCFLKEIEKDCNDYYHTVQNILKENPQLIISKSNMLKDMVVFDYEDGILHFFSSHDNIKNTFIDYKNQAKEKMKFFSKIHMQL